MSALRAFTSRISTIYSLILIAALLAGCQGSSVTGTQVSPASQARPQDTAAAPQAEITFDALLPAKLASGQNLFLEVLDEVTGLALNPQRTKMITTDGKTYSVKLAFPFGSVIKYRYFRDNSPFGIEYTSLEQPVRYRLYAVEGPGVVRDTVAAWKDTPVSGGLGRIQGQVANKSSNAPVVNALVAAGGLQTITASDGSFLLEGLPPGTHNLVIYSLDGSFRTFQQGAVVASDATTPALVMMNPSKTVSVTFLANPPKDSPKGVPVRLIGNIYPLGNTFADLSGGTSVIASRAPLMTSMENGRYSLTIKLPVGLDLRYKYTLGDGFWNAERATDGGIQVRQLIVPDKDITVQDEVATWKTSGFAPISFTVQVPDTTSATDTVSIQFNPYAWTGPIPMWPVGKNRWFYVLYNPMDVFKTASYRYCRNDQCGVADAADTRGPKAQGKSFTPSSTEQTIEDKVSAWAWSEAASEPVVVSAAEIAARDNFQAGVEFMPAYHPSWQPYLNSAFQNIKDTGGNTVMLTPTWRVTHKAPPVIQPVPGQDPLWFDTTQMAAQAQQKGLGIVLHPILRYSEDPNKWWQTSTRDDGWWQSWFDRYRTFILYHADLATQTGAKVLVIGDDTILPALPGGKLVDGTPSGVPGNAEERWAKLIADVRARYTGKLAWFIPFAGKMPPVIGSVDKVDMLYVQISAPLIKADAPTPANLEARFAAILDDGVLKLQEKTNQPVMLGVQYPSAPGAFDNCVDSGGKCLLAATFQRPAVETADGKAAFNEQAAVYSAALTVLNQRSWINGFYAVGYYPPAEIKDLSVSPRGKPASDVLWYWFPRLTGQDK